MRNSGFSNLQEPAQDPIIKRASEAAASGPDRIDATIGVLLDDKTGELKLLPSVAQAMTILHARGVKLAYAKGNGMEEYRTAIHNLLFSKNGKSIVESSRVGSIATTGGTGAVYENLRYLKKNVPNVTMVVPTPTWVNHQSIIDEVGIPMETVPYLDEQGKPTIEHMVAAARAKSSAILLHTSCHNPTGLDLTQEQWKELAKEMGNSPHESFAFMDSAYLGFADELENDTQPIHTMANEGVTVLNAWSGAKTFGVYGQRVGMASIVTPDAENKRKVDGHLNILMRREHSTAATYGQQLVTVVEQHQQNEHRNDLRGERRLIRDKKDLAIQDLPPQFAYPFSGNGLFVTLPVSVEAVAKMMQRHRAFTLDDGRANIASVPFTRICEFTEIIKKCM